MKKNQYFAAAWLLGLAGLMMMPKLVFWPAALWFGAYVAFNMYRASDPEKEE